MKRIVILFVVFTFSGCKAQKVSSMDCEKCDISKVTAVYNKQKESITYNDVKAFLCTFDESCKNNAEYSEFSNEVLYDLLEKKPETVIDVLAKEKTIKSKYIYEIVASPINDSFDLKKIYTEIEKIGAGDSNVKSRLLTSLKMAIDKS